LARGLKEAKQRQTTPEAVTIFTDAQAAIRRMVSEEPGPGQQYAIEARQHVAALRRARPDIRIEIRWCPAHKGVTGNEIADTWAKLAADEPDAHGVEWLAHADGSPRRMPLPRSLAHLSREATEKKWKEARQWSKARIKPAKYKIPERQLPDRTVAGCSKRSASRFYQLRSGHALTGQYLKWTKSRPSARCEWCQYQCQTRDHLLKNCPEWRAQQKVMWSTIKKETGRWKSRWKIRDLFADPRCSQAILDFLASTQVGRRAPKPEEEEEDAQSEASEWELREREERDEERRQREAAMGAEEEERLVFLPLPFSSVPTGNEDIGDEERVGERG